jgi:hypothetical protein
MPPFMTSPAEKLLFAADVVYHATIHDYPRLEKLLFAAIIYHHHPAFNVIGEPLSVSIIMNEQTPRETMK